MVIYFGPLCLGQRLDPPTSFSPKFEPLPFLGLVFLLPLVAVVGATLLQLLLELGLGDVETAGKGLGIVMGGFRGRSGGGGHCRRGTHSVQPGGGHLLLLVLTGGILAVVALQDHGIRGVGVDMPPQHGGRYHLDLMGWRQEDALRHRGLEARSLSHRWIHPGAGTGTLATAVVLLLRRQEAQLLAQLIGEAANLLGAAGEEGSGRGIPGRLCYMTILVIRSPFLTSYGTHDGLLRSRWIRIELLLLGGLMTQYRKCVGHHVLEIIGTLIPLDVVIGRVVVIVGVQERVRIRVGG